PEVTQRGPRQHARGRGESGSTSARRTTESPARTGSPATPTGGLSLAERTARSAGRGAWLAHLLERLDLLIGEAGPLEDHLALLIAGGSVHFLSVLEGDIPQLLEYLGSHPGNERGCRLAGHGLLRDGKCLAQLRFGQQCGRVQGDLVAFPE